VTPKTTEQLAVVEELIEGDLKVDSWTEWNGIGLAAQLMVPMASIQKAEQAFEDAGMTPKTLLQNVAQTIREHHKEDVQAESMMPMSSSVVGKYPRIAELYTWYETIASQHKHVTILSVGKSHQGRYIKVVKIAKRPNLPVVFVECMVHAREWVAMASCVWDINELLTSTQDDIKKLTDNLEFQFVPCSNPDGYEYTHTGQRLWRKNRNPNGGDKCPGVDLNRNWDHRWGRAGVHRTNKCSSVYCGTQPFSEPETVAIAEHVMGQKSRIKAYIAFHCYTQLWLVPPGDGPKPPDFNDLVKVGKGAVAAMKAMHGESYLAGSPQDILYSASGSSLDWAHDPVKGPGIKYVYTPELRPTRNSRFGFQLPVSEIVPASEEAFAGLKYVADVVILENPVAAPTTTPPPQRRRRRSRTNRRRTRVTRRRRRRKTSRRRRRRRAT